MPYSKAMPNGIQLAAAHLGGQAELARVLQVSPPTVNQWIKGRRPVPVDKCVAIETATQGKVSRRDLRPNDWQAIWPELERRVKPRADSDKPKARA